HFLCAIVLFVSLVVKSSAPEKIYHEGHRGLDGAQSRLGRSVNRLLNRTQEIPFFAIDTIMSQPSDTPRQALLFIPDISGFTEFVNVTEVQHSQHIIQELLDELIQANRIGLQVSEIEGD